MVDEKKEDAPPVEAEVVDQGFSGGTLGSLVRQGQALMKAENDSLAMMAKTSPRDEARFIKTALERLELMPEQAKEMFYSIPYKDRQSDGTTRIVRVEGPSIDAAMALAQLWGRCTVTARLVNEDDDGFDLEGVFVDLENIFRVVKPWRVSKLFKRRDGKTEMLNVQRLNLAVQAGFSKAARNAVLAGIPALYVKAFFEKSKEIAGGKPEEPAKPQVIEAIAKAFEKLGVKIDELEKYADSPRAKWTGEDVANLRGLYNALKDKQVTMAELTQPERKIELDGGTIRPDTLFGAPVTASDEPDRKEGKRR